MQYISHYHSPLGDLLLAADQDGLTGLWFVGQKYFARLLREDAREQNLPVFLQAHIWLDAYFSGRDPGFSPPLHLIGTPFQRQVWSILRTVPYGQTITYGQMARLLARQQGRPQSARAVGSAVGRNPISILVPCHRVVGADGSLTGYAGGIHRKSKLLQLEGVILSPSPSKIQHICAD